MNRNFLLFLMIGTALMILVIGGEPIQDHPDYTPWNISILENNKTKVFGITLGKTAVQDANQIFASFPETQLILRDDGEHQLFALYKELKLGGLIADIQVAYKLDKDMLENLAQSANINPETGQTRLPEELEISLLSSTIDSLIYKPSVDYETEIILQRFGPPDSEETISDTITHWLYPDTGLKIILNTKGLDTFMYSLLTGNLDLPEVNNNHKPAE